MTMASGISRNLERDNYSNLGLGVVHVESSMARDTLEKYIPSSLLPTIVTPTHPVWGRLNADQKGLVKNSPRDGYANFDITLCYSLLRNVCTQLNSPNKLAPPIGGWGNGPLPYNQTIGDDVERLRILRNNMHGHKAQTYLPEAEFRDHWQQLKDICSRMQTHLNKDYLTELSNLEKYELSELDIKTLIGEMEEIKKVMKQITKAGDNQKISAEKIEEFNSVLLALNREETRNVPVSPLQPKILPLDLICAPVSIRKDLEDDIREISMGQDDDENEPELVNVPDDIFLKNGEPTRFIVMQGEAGRGKSWYCLQLMKHWCNAKEATKELSDWEKSLGKYKFLFCVKLRDMEKDRASIVDMICDDINYKGYPWYTETIRHVLSTGEYTCLIIMDGLDEWTVNEEVKKRLKHSCIPNIRDITCSCTFFLTMRPWKFEAVRLLIRNKDRVIEIQGLDDSGIKIVIEKVLVNYCRVAKSSKEYQTIFTKITKKTKDVRFSSLLKIPLIAIVSVILWFEKKDVGKSLTTFFVSIVRMLIERGLENEIIDIESQDRLKSLKKDDLKTPKILRNEVLLKNYSEALFMLGEIGFADLLSTETRLVFEKREIEEKLGKLVLEFALKVGLLTQSEAYETATAKHVRISFFHKTIQELLTAMYISSKEEASELFLEHLSSTESIMEFENVNMFVSGMNPSLGETLSQHVAKVANADQDVLRYRETFDHNLCNKVPLLYKMQLSCLRELRQSGLDLSHATQQRNYHISDVYVSDSSDIDTVRMTADVLRDYKTNIVSLYIVNVPTDRQHGIDDTVINDFLQQTTSLQAFRIHGSNKRALHTINTLTSLKALVLYSLTITPSLLHDIESKILNNTDIRTLCLVFIKCRDLGETGHRPLSKKCTPALTTSFCGLLRNLPRCRNLSDLRISYRLNLEERQMLINVLPKLSLKVVAYYGSTAYRGKDDDEYDYTLVHMVLQWTHLKKLVFGHISLGGRSLELPPDMKGIEEVFLVKVKMSAEGWGKFITSVIKIKHKFNVFLQGTDISDDYGTMIRSSSDFTVTRHDVAKSRLDFTRKCPLTSQAQGHGEGASGAT